MIVKVIQEIVMVPVVVIYMSMNAEDVVDTESLKVIVIAMVII